MRLEDETVFITGAGSGIGRATSLRCAEEGAYVIVTDVDEDGAAETVEQIENLDTGGAESHRLDVTDAEEFDAMIEATAEEHGLDVVVNNAGTGHPPQSMEDVGEAMRDYVIDVNIKGVWNGCHAALPIMKDQGHGAIVNVGSLASIFGLPKQAAYSLTKGAVLNFTRAVAAEAGPYGVRANTVCPGFTDTPMVQQMFQSYDDPEAAREKMEEGYPLKRLGEAEEIADAILFLASSEASWITGEGLVVDGGFRTAGGG
ncbi:SDR family NAD(P)-dependent oxidoreductase [Halorientalis brevis]|uniref:SDR family NAD(P)-dependent oxidoreductase n=1 Tax=Halorientalis brevis TaxID=1126241 RepID=A0ABD6CCM9_9EURY|nr:SDR family oxidoreductase [Halorientalis brevis]